MKFVTILVEGYTEDGFVRGVLQPHLWNKGVHLEPTIFTTKRVVGGKNLKGGGLGYANFKKDIQNLLRDTSTALVTTLIGFHGLFNFPGLDTMHGTPYDKVRIIKEMDLHDIRAQCPHFNDWLTSIERLAESD